MTVFEAEIRIRRSDLTQLSDDCKAVNELLERRLKQQQSTPPTCTDTKTRHLRSVSAR